MENSEHFDLDNNGFNLIDLSSENDNLFFAVSPLSHKHKFTESRVDSTGFEGVGDKDSGNVSQGNDQLKQKPELAQSEEPQRVKIGKCNLRKSLAWDKAFFTSAGVLDPEELTSMMNQRETQHQFLPRIQEDIQRSTNSISTLGSDNYTLESLDVELFEDIKASIQKPSTTAKGTSEKKAIRKDGDQDISSPNGDSVAPNQLKLKPVIKKVTGVPKCQPKVASSIQGSVKAVEPESNRSVVPRSAVRIGESTSSLAKPPKRAIKSSSATPTGIRVTSLDPSRPKIENNNAKTVAVRGPHAPKISSSEGPSRILLKSGLTSKSSSREPSMAKIQFTRPSSRGASSDSQSSEDGVKPSLATVRRKAPSRVVNSPSPGATSQSSSKSASLKKKITSENSAVAAYLLSSKVHSSISPTSSVSEWSTASSSSSPVNKRSSKSRSSFGSSSCRSVDGDPLNMNMEAHTYNQIRRCPETKRSTESFKRPALQAGVVSGSTSMKPTGSCRAVDGDPLKMNIEAHTNNQIRHCPETKRSTESFKKPALQAGVVSGSNSMKPTGLRMPSPKIGFFDGVKSVRPSSASRQSDAGLPMSKLGPGVSPKGITNIKQKVGKLPPGRLSTGRKRETEKDASLPAQGKSQATSRNGDHEKKMVESPVKVQEKGSEKQDEVSPKEILGVTKKEMMLDVNEDLCLKDVQLVDSEHKERKSNGDHEQKMVGSPVKVQENGSEEHDDVSPKENLAVTKTEMMLAVNEDLCLKDVQLVDSEHKECKSNGDHEKKMVGSLVKVQENGSAEHDQVSPKENIGVAKKEMMLDVNEDLCLKVVQLVDPEHNERESNGDHEKKMVGSPVKLQEIGSEQHDKVGPKENLGVTEKKMLLDVNEDLCLKDVQLVDPEHKGCKSNGDHGKMVGSLLKVHEFESEEHDKVDPKENPGVSKKEVMLYVNEVLGLKDVQLVDPEHDGDHEKKMVGSPAEVQENESEEHDKAGPKENPGVTKKEVMLDVNEDLGLKDFQLVNPEDNGDHEKKMVGSPVEVQENGSEEHDKVSPKENPGVSKKEVMLDVNEDLCLKDDQLVDPQHNGDHEKKMVGSLVEVQENGSEEHDQVSPKENLGVTKKEMIDVNEDLSLKDVQLVDPLHKELKTDSFEPTANASEKPDDLKIDGHHGLGSSLNPCCKIDEKENFLSEDRMDQSSKDEGRVTSGKVYLQTIEPLQVTRSEV